MSFAYDFFPAFRWYNRGISRDKAEKLLLDTVSLPNLLFDLQ